MAREACRRPGVRRPVTRSAHPKQTLAGVVAAVAGKLFIGSSDSLAAAFFEAIAGGAVLALVAHAMIPEAIHEGGSIVMLPTVAGFLLALYIALAGASV